GRSRTGGSQGHSARSPHRSCTGKSAAGALSPTPFHRRDRASTRCQSRHYSAAPADSAMRGNTGHGTGTGVPQDHDSRDRLTPAADSQSTALGNRRRLLTLEEAAEYLALSTWTVRDLVWKGRLRVVRLTRRLHFDRRDLDRLIEEAKDSGY